jgi:hypothetical protein
MNNYVACPVCRCPSLLEKKADWSEFDCLRCGEYLFNLESRSALEELNLDSDAKIALVSGWIREHQGELLKRDAMIGQLGRKQIPVGEKAEKLLRGLAVAMPVPGENPIMPIPRNADQLLDLFRVYEPFQALGTDDEFIRENGFALYLLGVSQSQTFGELNYLLFDYLVAAKEFVITDADQLGIKISPAGWAHLDDTEHRGNSMQAFVAMMFSNETDKLWADGISKGISDAGYKPFRIDKHDHNNRIDDEIIAAIRKSKFLVADFTGNRGGVYFEAGFALGLGQQVIWLCRKDELGKVHFDTRQYNHITWEMDKLPELARALTLRIEATIGRGELGNEI